MGDHVRAVLVVRHPRSLRTGARLIAAHYRTLRARTGATSLRHRAPRGSTLTFRVTATDAAGNDTVRRAVLTFRGTGVAVFLARGSRVRRITVQVDGRQRTLRESAGLRTPAFARGGLRRARHRIVIVAPGRGVRLDAVAVSR